MPFHLKEIDFIELAKSKFFFLFFSLVLLLLASPFALETKAGLWILSTGVALTLFAAVYAIGWENEKNFIFYGGFAILITFSDYFHLYSQSYAINLIHMVLIILFQIMVILALFMGVFKGKRITEDTIFGAMSLYLIIGIMYANVYVLIELIAPNSFKAAGISLFINPINAYELIYFSFTTLTTVGFGDILPTTAQAKSVVMLEEVSGVLYLAVLVARLVGSFSQTATRKSTRKSK